MNNSFFYGIIGTDIIGVSSNTITFDTHSITKEQLLKLIANQEYEELILLEKLGALECSPNIKLKNFITELTLELENNNLDDIELNRCKYMIWR